MHRCILLSAFLFACGDKDTVPYVPAEADTDTDTDADTDTDTDADADADTDTDTDTDTDADADADADTDTDTDTDTTDPYDLLEDPLAGVTLEPDEDCEELEGEYTSGATSYNAASFSLAIGEDPYGLFYQALEANAMWSNDGGRDCTIVWTMTGTRGSATGTCSFCDFSLSMFAEVDFLRSDCPSGATNDAEEFSATYNVDVSGSSVNFYNSEDAAFIGVGSSDGLSATFVGTTGECVFFED
jgi:hypothetical protein